MRAIGWGTVAVAVAASVTVASAAAPATVVLDGHGVTVAGKVAAFGRTPRAEAIALVATALGKPVRIGDHGDCGSDQIIAFAAFRGGFELTFVRGRLAGWTADAATPRTSKGIAVGATLAAVRRAYPDIDVDPGDAANGGLGASFQREDGPDGWLDGIRPAARVTGLYAGATCIVG